MFSFRCTCIVFAIGFQFFLAGVNGIEKKSEVNTHERGLRINHQVEENASHKYLQKRQISPQLPPFQSQDFSSFFASNQPNRNSPISQFPGQVTFDEEERFFLAGNQQEETTLNPLAFINPPRTTPSPAEQQVINEQRRFQEEIANKGLREQEQRSFGVPQPPTTTTTTTTTQNPLNQFPFQQDLFARVEPGTDAEQSNDNENAFFGDDSVPQSASPQSPLIHSEFSQSPSPQSALSGSAFPQSALPQPTFLEPSLTQSALSPSPSPQSAPPQPQSFSYSRIYRSLNRKSRSIDRQTLSVNLLPSTGAPPPTYYHQKRYQTTPRNEYGSIGNWLIAHFSQQLQQNIASLVQPTINPYTPRTIKSPHSNQQNYRRPSHTERPFTHPRVSYHRATPQPWQLSPESNIYSTTPQTWHSSVIPSTESPVSSTPSQFFYTRTSPKEASSSVSQPFRYQISQLPPQVTEHIPKEEVSSDIPQSGQQAAAIPQITEVSFKPLPAAYMVQPHVSLIPHTIPTYSPFTVSSTPDTTEDYTRASKVKNVQILTTSSPAPPLPHELLSYPQSEEAIFQAYRQIFAADHQKLHPTETVTVQPTTSESTEDSTSITSLFKTKLKEFKSFHPSQVVTLKDSQSKFQQPNQYLDQLHQQYPDKLNPFLSSNSENSADLTDNNGAKTAIFIRVPVEEPTSTVGYVFDKALSAKTLQKKENLSGHKKNYRSAQVIKSSLVYRTPPGKRATVSREELVQNNQVDSKVVSNILEAGKPIKWLFSNTAAPTTTNRPFVSAFLNFFQKRSSP